MMGLESLVHQRGELRRRHLLSGGVHKRVARAEHWVDRFVIAKHDGSQLVWFGCPQGWIDQRAKSVADAT